MADSSITRSPRRERHAVCTSVPRHVRLTEGNEKNENDVIFLARNLFPIRYDGACTMVEERFFFFLLPEKRVYPWPTTASSTRFSGKGRDSLSSFS